MSNPASPSVNDKNGGLTPSSSRSRLQEYAQLFDPPQKDVFSNQAHLLRKVDLVAEVKEQKEVRPQRVVTLENVESDPQWEMILNFHLNTKLPCVAIVACFDFITPISKKLRNRYVEIAKKYEDCFFYRMHQENCPLSFRDLQIVTMPTFIALVHGKPVDRVISEDAREVLELVRNARKKCIYEELTIQGANPSGMTSSPPKDKTTNSPERQGMIQTGAGVLGGNQDKTINSPSKITPSSQQQVPPSKSNPAVITPLNNDSAGSKPASPPLHAATPEPPMDPQRSLPEVVLPPSSPYDPPPTEGQRVRTDKEIEEARRRSEAHLGEILDGIKRSLSKASTSRVLEGGRISNLELGGGGGNIDDIEGGESRESLARRIEDAFNAINDHESLFPEEDTLAMKYQRAKAVLRQKERALRKLHQILVNGGIAPGAKQGNNRSGRQRVGGRYAAARGMASSDFASSMGEDDRLFADDVSDIVSELDEDLYKDYGSDYDSVFEDEQLAQAYQRVNGPLKQVLVKNELRATQDALKRSGNVKEAKMQMKKRREEMIKKNAAAAAANGSPGQRARRFGWEGRRSDADNLSNFSDAYSIELGEDLEDLEARHRQMEQLSQEQAAKTQKCVKVTVFIVLTVIVITIPVILFTLFPELVG